MLKKWVSLILIATLSIAILGTGCSDNTASEGDKAETTATQKNAAASDSSEKTLSICYFSPLDTYYTTILQNFRNIHSDISIKEKALTTDNFDSFQETFQAETAAGQGADIITLPTWGLPNSYKLMQDGLLCDLNPLISKDIELKIENYNENILNAGIYNGKRYFIPVDYCFSYFYTFNAILGKYKLNTTNWTWDNLIKIAKDYCEGGKGTKKYFFDSSFNFWDFKYSDKSSYVDYNKKTSNFNSEGFIKLLKTYKELLPYVCPKEVEEKETISEKRLKLSLLHTENFTGVVKDTAGSVRPFKQDPIYVPYPTFDGKKSINSFATNIVAITSKCKYKEEAFDYIKIMLSKTMQEDETLNAPVMKSVFTEQSKFFKPTTKSSTSITNLFDKINSCTLGDGNVDEIIKAELPDFVSGKNTAEQTAKAIDDKVKELFK